MSRDGKNFSVSTSIYSPGIYTFSLFDGERTPCERGRINSDNRFNGSFLNRYHAGVADFVGHSKDFYLTFRYAGYNALSVNGSDGVVPVDDFVFGFPCELVITIASSGKCDGLAHFDFRSFRVNGKGSGRSDNCLAESDSNGFNVHCFCSIL